MDTEAELTYLRQEIAAIRRALADLEIRHREDIVRANATEENIKLRLEYLERELQERLEELSAHKSGLPNITAKEWAAIILAILTLATVGTEIIRALLNRIPAPN